MNFDDTSNTWLQLNLGHILHDQYGDHENFNGHRKSELSKKKKIEIHVPLKCTNEAYPFLTLGPSNEIEDEKNTKIQHSTSKTESCGQNLVTSPSIESLFSNSTSIKKESGEEFVGEIEKVPIKKIENVDEDGNPKKKLRLTKEQSQVLEESFREHSTLNQKQKQALAKELNLQARQLEVWFQNRRARTKLKQTELNYEVLKKCCETLKEENKKLQKEIQELKSMQTVAATPIYMHINPTCEKISGGYNNNIINESFLPTTTLLIGNNNPLLYKK